MKINSFDPLFEYPNYNQTGTNAKANAAAKSVTAPGAKPSAKPSASPTTTGNKPPEPKQPTIAKAKELKKDFEFPDENGKVLTVVSPVGQRTDLPNDMEDIVIAKDQQNNIRVFGSDAEIALPQVEESASLDNILDRKKTNFAKKISRKQNKIKQLIRAQKFGNTHKEPVFELDFNRKEIMQNALDAPIQCGFEAETTWPNFSGGVEGFDWDYSDWGFVEDAARDQGYSRELARMKDAYGDWVSEIALDYEGEVVQRMVDQRKEDEAYIDEFISSELSESDIEEYKDEKLDDLRNIVDQGDMFDSETLERKQAELDEYEDWDDNAWGREYTEEFAQSALEEWIADQIRDEGEAWEEAFEEARDNNDMDRWVQAEYDGSWAHACSDFDIYMEDENYNDLDQVEESLSSWASAHSKTDDIRQGSYHSGKSIDNTYWRVEDDSSIEGEGSKAEIISPVYQTPREMLTEMKSLFEHFEEEGVETNSTTGLHVTMSFGGETKKINPLVLATLLGDKYVLTQFNRQYNSYAKSQQENIQQEIERMLAQGGTPEDFDELYGILSRGIDGGKFTSINFKQGAKNSDDNQLVEFRIAGGNNYHGDYDKAAKAVIRYAATMNASSEEDPANRKDFLKTVYRMVNKGGDSLTPTRKDSNVSLPENDFVQAVRYILNQTGQRLDAVETLDRAYKELAGGDGVLAKEHFTEFMKTLLVSIRNSERTGSFKLKPNSMLVRGFKQAMKQFGVSREDIIRAVSQNFINMADHITTSTDSDIHDDFIVPTVAILDKILLRKNQPQPERGPSLALPSAQNGVTYIRRSAYAGQRQYDKDAPVNIANDVKTIPMHDHVEIDKLIIARNLLTDHPHELDPNLAAEAKQKVAKIDANLAEYEKTYGIKFASRYSKAGQEMDAFQLASSTDPVWQRHLRSKGIHLYKAESKTFDRFDAMSLAEQLALLSKVDKRKIDEVYKPYRRSGSIDDNYRKQFKRDELEYELRNEPANNYAVFINGKKWKVVANRQRAERMAQTLINKGKDAKVHITGEPVSEADQPTDDKSSRAKLDLNLRDRGHKVEKPKKGKGSFKRTEKHRGKLPEADQVKTKERKPKTIKPNTGHQSKHPYQGRLVGESQHLEEGMDGILKAFAIAGVILFVGAYGVKQVEQKREWNAAYEEIKTQDPAKADEIKRLMRKYKMSVSNKNLSVMAMQYKNDINKIIDDFEKQNGLNEGAVPETGISDEFAQLMSKPLLGSDLKSQMYAFQIVPDPAMLQEFRKQISMAGKDVDLRQTFKHFANAKLHPVQKKSVGLREAIVGNPSPESVPGYIAVINDMLKGDRKLPMGSNGDHVFVADPGQTVNALGDIITGKGQDHLGKDSVQVIVKNLHKGTIRNLAAGGGAEQERMAFNRGEQAEGYHALAAFVRFVARPTRDITLEEVVSWIPKVKNGVTKVVKVKDAENKELADEFHVTIALKPDQWKAFQRPDIVLQDKQMSKIAQNVIDDANSETGRRADDYATNGRYDIVRIIGDGVSGETETKTDIEFENEIDKKYRGYSIKAGTVKQIHQVGGGAVSGAKAVSPEERWNIIANELFGVHGREQIADISSSKEQYLNVCNNNSVECRLAGQKLAYDAATKSFNEKLSSDDKEKSFIKSFARALKYFQARDDDKILLKQFTGTKAGTYILDPKRLDKLHKLGFDLIATYGEDNKELPYIDIIDKDTGDNLVRFRTYMDGKGYIRNYIEKGPLWKKVTNIAKNK